MMGVGSGLCDVQTIALLASVYADQADFAFAIMKLCHHLCMMLGFAYAGYLTLYWQLGILLTLGLFGAVSFTAVDVKRRETETTTKEKQAEVAPFIEIT